MDLQVLFVCTGNICRSPTAERLAAAYGLRMRLPNFYAASAGTRAVIADPMNEQAKVVLENLGGTANGFFARQLTTKVAAQADLVIAMTKGQRDRVLELAPRQLRRTFTLTEASVIISECNPVTVEDLAALRPQYAAQCLPDIQDPIGQDQEVFVAVGTEIMDRLSPVLDFCRRQCAS